MNANRWLPGDIAELGPSADNKKSEIHQKFARENLKLNLNATRQNFNGTFKKIVGHTFFAFQSEGSSQPG